MVSRFNDVWGCLSALPDKTESSKECSRSKLSVSSNHREIGPYRSPLVYFRSYRFSPYFRTKEGLTLDSPTFTHLINPRLPFCSFALQGVCNDSECLNQHPDDVLPKNKQILQDLAAYFVPARHDNSGDNDFSNDTTQSIERTIDEVSKQYGSKVSVSELRVLFVNYLRKKQKSAGVYNVILERRHWTPRSDTKKNPGITVQGESPVVRTTCTFTWKGWRRKMEKEIKARNGVQDERQEIRYFSENYDSIKTLEHAISETPHDETLWIRLAMIYMETCQGKRNGDENNNDKKKSIDKALNILSKALECNRHSEKLWLKYLDVYKQRAQKEELYEVCDEAVVLAGSYDVWWVYMDIAYDCKQKTLICMRCIEYLMFAKMDSVLKSHRLLEKMKCDDFCLLWLCYIHIVEFSCLPRELYDPSRTGHARITRKESVTFPWKPSGGTRQSFGELSKLFQRAIKDCTDAFVSSKDINPLLCLLTNLKALERATGKDASSLRSCQRLLKAHSKNIDFWLCACALQRASGNQASAVNTYKKALEACNGHAQIAYCAAKYYFEMEKRELCLDALRKCVYTKFVLEVQSPGPKTRARSHDKPRILQPEPGLLYKKLLSQTLPLDSKLPSLKVNVCDLESETTYIWLCYCLHLELISEPNRRHIRTKSAYETAIYGTSHRHDVKILWMEYIHYMIRKLNDGIHASEELHYVFNQCLSNVPVVTPVNYTSLISWSDYTFHNQVLTLFRRCLGDAFTVDVYERYLDMFPDNAQLAIQTVELSYSKKMLNKTRKILSNILLKTPCCLELWKIAISIELKEQNFDEARLLYEHATETLPFVASLWKDFAMFELAHGNSKTETLQRIVSKAKERAIDLELYFKELTS